MDKILRTIEQLRVSSSSPVGMGGSEVGETAEGYSYPSSIPSAISFALISAAGGGRGSGGTKMKKTDRIENCTFITESICSTSLQLSKEFPKILESVVQLLFVLCDDSEADIRLVARDSLYRITKSLRDSQLSKFQAEVLRQIRKDAQQSNSSKSVRVALTIFGWICPSIRPIKIKAFSSSLVPALEALALGQNEQIYEHLQVELEPILLNLGPHFTESEMNLLVGSYLGNLASKSNLVRRVSAGILVDLVQSSNSRTPWSWKLLRSLIDLIELSVLETDPCLLVGILLCLRNLLPVLYAQLQLNEEVANIFRIYELCLLLLHHDDHNVITTSLETIRAFMGSGAKVQIPYIIRNQLVGSGGILNTFGGAGAVKVKRKSSGSDDGPVLASREKTHNRTHLLSSTSSEAEESSELFLMANTSECEPEEPDAGPSVSEDPDLSSPLDPCSDFPEPVLGSLYDLQNPIYYCARFLAYSFLLSGKSGNLRPDTEIRTSVKVLALHSIAASISLCPDVFFLVLDKELEDQSQRISDILLYTNHSDPLVRGTVYLLLGALINRITTPPDSKLLQILFAGLQDQSNQTIKYCLEALGFCINKWITLSEYQQLILDRIIELIKTNPYWNLRLGVVELLVQISSSSTNISSHRIQPQLILTCLTDKDPRVRARAVGGLVQYIKSFQKSVGWMSPVLSVIDSFQYPIFNIPSTTALHSDSFSLNSTITELMVLATNTEAAETNFTSALATLAEAFPPKEYPDAWGIAPSPSSPSWLFQWTLDMLRTSPLIAGDLVAHRNALALAGNLYFAICDSDGDRRIGPLAQDLVHHILEIIRAYARVLITTSYTRPPQSITYGGLGRKFSMSRSTGAAIPEAHPILISHPLPPEEIESQSASENQSTSNFYLPTHFASQSKRIYDSIYSSYQMCRNSLDIKINQRFESLLATALGFLGKIPSRDDSGESGKVYILHSTFLQLSPTLMNVLPVAVLQAGTRIWRNLCCPNGFPDLEIKVDLQDFEDFWSICFPSQLIGSAGNGTKYNHPPVPPSGGTLAQCIKSFEPLVIKALRIYCTSGASAPAAVVQASILQLLLELIRSRINYGLVDSSGGFLNQVIKQVGWLEEGLLDPGKSGGGGNLVSSMFEFFILLANGTEGSGRRIDYHKILCFLDSLLASGQPINSHVLSALRPLVYDVFVRQTQSQSSATKDLETLREVLFQITIKIGATAWRARKDIWSIWILILSSRSQNQSKLKEESDTVYAYLVKYLKLPTGLEVGSEVGFILVALLCSLHSESFPDADELEVDLRGMTNNVEADPTSRVLHLVMYWTLLGRRFGSTARADGSIATADLIISALKFIAESDIPAQALELPSVYHCLIFALKKLSQTNLRAIQDQLRAPIYIELLTGLVARASSGSSCDYSIQMLSLLKILKYPHPSVYVPLCQNRVYQKEVTELFLEAVDLDADLRTWLIENCAPSLLEDNLTFLNAFESTFWIQIIQKLIADPSKPPEKYLKKFLSILSGLAVDMKDPSGKLSSWLLSILLGSESLSLGLELSAWLSYLLLTSSPAVILSDKDRQTLHLKYPKLACQLMGQPMPDTHLGPFSLELCCCSDSSFSDSEGLAIANALSALSYTQLLGIYHEPKFNLSLLQYPFRYLRQNYFRGTISRLDLQSCLAGSQNHNPQLIQTLGLAVSSVDFLVLILDRLEFSSLEDSEMYLKLPQLWPVLTQLLELQQAIFPFPQNPPNRSNYIPIPIFIRSFQWFTDSRSRTQSRAMNIQKFGSFLKFVSITLSDWNFLNFWNQNHSQKQRDPARQNYTQSNCHSNEENLWTCVKSLGEALRRIGLGPNAIVTTSKSEFLNEFNYLLQIIQNPPGSMIDPDLHSLLKSTVAGLSRSLDTAYRWLLVSHLNFSNDSEFFPTISPVIPVQILSTEPEALIGFLSKLRLFGIAGSKSQFEESWMMLCSIVSRFGADGVGEESTDVGADVDIGCVGLGLQGLCMMLQKVVKVHDLVPEPENLMCEQLRGLEADFKTRLDESGGFCLKEKHSVGLVGFGNPLQIDILSCTQFLIELFTLWFSHPTNPTTKIPLPLLTTIGSTLVSLSDYFDADTGASGGAGPWGWMYKNVIELWKSFEREDEGTGLWASTVIGLFRSSPKVFSLMLTEGGNQSQVQPQLDPILLNLVEVCLGAGTVGVGANGMLSLIGVKGAFEFLQNSTSSENLGQILELLISYLMGQTSLNQVLNSTESHSMVCWDLILSIWINATASGTATVSSFASTWESQILQNIQTTLSPLNKVHTSIRILILQGLSLKILKTARLEPNTKRIISKIALDQLQHFKNPLVLFFWSFKLYVRIFYSDFTNFYNQSESLDPEILIQMSERLEIIFKILRSSSAYSRTSKELASAALSSIVYHFYPSSEILNRLVTELLSPVQKDPELIAPALVQVFRKSSVSAPNIVREWVTESLSHFIQLPDQSRAIWALGLIWIGLSKVPTIQALLPLVAGTKNPTLIYQLFLLGGQDYWSTLIGNEERQKFHGYFLLDSENQNSKYTHFLKSL